ncbi:uncharacterized protein NMK_2458 [Novimethylophilus kurashikiensis]|uniref:Uncharacterized protein n=1 Tax=Novimethylophilus kurashikiensis TaxID=1825523 RepID=A0A2R5F9I2_9PROT|nr:hypothetical protein [Novimethylophilus kurashikiensis]GBG14857.1 uncharacterized protein NMK_2458 [Novimethylophilus kurashikiensis]
MRYKVKVEIVASNRPPVYVGSATVIADSEEIAIGDALMQCDDGSLQADEHLQGTAELLPSLLSVQRYVLDYVTYRFIYNLDDGTLHHLQQNRGPFLSESNGPWLSVGKDVQKKLLDELANGQESLHTIIVNPARYSAEQCFTLPDWVPQRFLWVDSCSYKFKGMHRYADLRFVYDRLHNKVEYAQIETKTAGWVSLLDELVPEVESYFKSIPGATECCDPWDFIISNELPPWVVNIKNDLPSWAEEEPVSSVIGPVKVIVLSNLVNGQPALYMAEVEGGDGNRHIHQAIQVGLMAGLMEPMLCFSKSDPVGQSMADALAWLNTP